MKTRFWIAAALAVCFSGCAGVKHYNVTCGAYGLCKTVPAAAPRPTKPPSRPPVRPR